MKNLSKLLIVALVTLLCCPELSAQSKKAQKWFDAQEWLAGAEMSPAASIDVEIFANHYKEHPNRWNLLFETLKNSDLNALPLGLVELSDDLKMNIQEYTTRPTVGKKLLFEKHEDYIDVQCVIVGEELHAKSCLEKATVVTEYIKEKDIAMYSCVDAPFYIIGEKMFTIFFPSELHTTNYGFGEQTEVRKIVFKVKYN